MNKIQDPLSFRLNAEYLELKKEILKFKNLGLEASKKELTSLKKLEKNKVKIINSCKRNLVKSIKMGFNIVGALEHELLLEDQKLKKAWSKWARKRGYNFEKNLCDLINLYAKKGKEQIYCYRNYASKFGFQPYDLVVYSRNKEPVFIQCKASGVITNSKGTKIQACKRRYVNYTTKKVEKLIEFLNQTNSLLCFAYRHEQNNTIYFLSAKKILESASYLCEKQIDLTEEDYLEIPYNSELWPTNLFQNLKTKFLDRQILINNKGD